MRTKEEIRTLVDGELSNLVCKVCEADLTDDDCEMLDHAADVIACTIFDAESRKETNKKKMKELSDAISVLKKLNAEGIDVCEQLSLNGFACVQRIGTANVPADSNDKGVDSDFVPELKQIISEKAKPAFLLNIL